MNGYLYFLISRCADLSKTVEKIPKSTIKKAFERVFDIDYNIFRDTVLNYLNEDDRKTYADKRSWEEIQLKIGELLK